MKFNYWMFACIFFGLSITLGLIEAIVNGGSFSDGTKETLNDTIVLLGIMSYIDYKMEDRW